MSQGFSQALERFHAPTLASVQPALAARWKAQWPQPGLADEIMANPRLEGRIMDRLLQAAGVSSDTTLTLAPTAERVVGCLMTHGPDALALRTGCALHRATLIQWITWGKIDQHLPDLPLDQLKPLITKIPEDTAQAAGAPSATLETLTSADIRSDGAACISSWVASADPDIQKRLALFCDVQPGAVDIGKAELVAAVAMKLPDPEES